MAVKAVMSLHAKRPLESRLLLPPPYPERFDHQPHDQNHRRGEEREADQASLKPTFPRVKDDGLLRVTRLVTDADGARRCIRRGGYVIGRELLAIDLEVGEATLFSRRHTVSVPNHEVRRFDLGDQ